MTKLGEGQKLHAKSVPVLVSFDIFPALKMSSGSWMYGKMTPGDGDDWCEITLEPHIPRRH